MTKTIIISTDEMKQIIIDNFSNSADVLDILYCRHCRERNGCCESVK